jgi:ACS family tartrate transporter-like MFS transporter
MTDKIEEVVLRKVKWRLLPMAMVLFFMSLLDRTSISVASLDMNNDLGISFDQFSFALSVFYLGYVPFEIPSNYALQWVGARVWLARIMVTWGAVVVAHAFVQGATSLYAVRILLGAAEAGLLPGLLWYFAKWLPARERGLAFGTLLSTTAVTYAAGAPFTAWLMTFSVFGLYGWQMMYVVQGALTIVIGVAALFLLPSAVTDATWLTAEEKDWLQRELADEETRKKTAGATTIREGFLDRRVLMMTATCFFLLCANFGTVLFLPQILKPAFPALTTFQITLLISLAFAGGCIAGIISGRNSDRTGDRKWHMAAGGAVAAVGYAYAAYADTPVLMFAGICIGVLGIWSMFGAFWAYSGDFLGGAAAAGGLALINSVGSIGGFVAPIVLGAAKGWSGSFSIGGFVTPNVLAWAKDWTSPFSGSLLALAAFSLATALLAASLRKVERV